MIIIDPDTGCYVTTNPLTLEQQQAIMASKRARAGLPFYTEPNFPEGRYLKCCTGVEFWGAIRLEGSGEKWCAIHPLILKPNKKFFSIFAELSIIYCKLNHLTPYTTVFNDRKHAYMRKYLIDDLDLIKDTWANGSWSGYYLPLNWTPKYLNAYTVGDFK